MSNSDWASKYTPPPAPKWDGKPDPDVARILRDKFQLDPDTQKWVTMSKFEIAKDIFVTIHTFTPWRLWGKAEVDGYATVYSERERTYIINKLPDRYNTPKELYEGVRFAHYRAISPSFDEPIDWDVK